jgi:ubiquinone/menaquinone biosynthesis C-methylase UbiE
MKHNVFVDPETANSYDAYYQTEFGKKVDEIERQIVSSLIQDVPRTRMLELGCGTGHWSAYFIGQGFGLTGTDVSEAMLKLAREKELNAGFIQADARNIPFEDESFAVVSSITMLEFVDNQDSVFQEIYRVLKPGGWLILGCLNARSVLGENKEQDETFKNAQFITAEELTNKLQLFGEPTLKSGVYLTSDFILLDETPDQGDVHPVFIAAIVQKTK